MLDSHIEVCRKQFGERIRLYRQMRGWDLDDLATRLGKSTATMSRIETGKQNLTMVDIVAIAEALEVSPRDLFHDGNEEGGHRSSGMKIIATRCEKVVNAMSAALAEASSLTETARALL